MHGAEISRDLLLTFAPSSRHDTPHLLSRCWAALLSLFCTLHSWFYHKPSPHQYTLIVQCQDNFWLTTFMLFHVSTNLMFKTVLYLPLMNHLPSHWPTHVAGAEAAGQGIQVPGQRQEVPGAVRDCSQRHHKLQLQISRGPLYFWYTLILCSSNFNPWNSETQQKVNSFHKYVFGFRTWLTCLIDVRGKKHKDYRPSKTRYFKFINV